ncbi:Protein kish-A [Diplodia seriata]|uniref:Protein kish-A n=1 Tax=Diplodia seriata TaxID=420778 RepID=A0A1S8B746_9PEZI|nr:Protein kish-A [Diplodia seriata]
MDRNKDGVFGIFWKFARVGERLSPYVSLCCVVMAVSLLPLPHPQRFSRRRIRLLTARCCRLPSSSASKGSCATMFCLVRFVNGIYVWERWRFVWEGGLIRDQSMLEILTPRSDCLLETGGLPISRI